MYMCTRNIRKHTKIGSAGLRIPSRTNSRRFEDIIMIILREFTATTTMDIPCYIIVTIILYTIPYHTIL